MPRKPDPEESWMTEVAELMVRESIPFRRAAEAIGKVVTPIDAQLLERKKAFQRVLWRVSYRYFEELGNDPNRSKGVLLGQMVHCIKKLMDDGNYKDAVDAGLKLAKVEYNLQDESVNIFSSLSGDDLQKVREEIKAKADVERKLAN